MKLYFFDGPEYTYIAFSMEEGEKILRALRVADEADYTANEVEMTVNAKA